MELRIHRAMEEMGAAEWNGMTGSDCPFLRHEFLSALEHHGAVCAETGWVPHHLGLYEGDRLVAAAPAYLKSHSWGEFVFDFAWADAYERHGLDYYPKLVVSVPYTPATGPRVVTAPGRDREALIRALARAAREVCDVAGLSSLHWLFPQPADARVIAGTGYLVRYGCQYHWYNPGYRDFEDFLSALTSKKRKNIRRERRRVAEAGVTLRIVHGDEADTGLWRDMHRFYRNTFRAHGNLPLISRECFEDIGARLGRDVVLVAAERDGRRIAGAICLRGPDTLYGRYWGCDEEIDDLHFEACYYQGIDYCIREGLSRFEPGAQGEHKVARGFLPTLTRSCHHLGDPRFREAVDDFLARERSGVNEYVEMLTMEGPYREDSLRRLAPVR